MPALEPTGPRLPRFCAPGVGRFSDQASRRTHTQRLGCTKITAAVNRAVRKTLTVHHLVRALEAVGEKAAAALVTKIGSKAEIARELAYRLYTVCERKKRAQEALSYNGLVQSWPEIMRLSRDGGKAESSQSQLFSEE